MRRGRAFHRSRTVVVPTEFALRIAVPFQTVTETGFTDQSAVANTASAQHQVNDGLTPNDSDFLQTAAGPSSAQLRFKLTPFIMPTGDVSVRLRVKKA